MNQRTHPIVDPVLAVLACIMALALCLAGGCASPRNGAPCYALINFAPSLKVQLGGSDATVTVTETQTGSGHRIEKEIPVDATVSAATSLEAKGTP
jgi:hypothetical protein